MPKLINLDKMPSRFRRPDRKTLPPWEPGRSSRRILEILDTYRYLTTDLVGLVYAAENPSGRGKWHVRQELSKLWKYGYVERFYRPAEWGSNQFVYALGVDGARLVIEPGDWPDERRRVYNVARQKSDYEHALAVALFHVLWRVGSPSRADLFDTISVWQDKQGDRDRVVNEFKAQVGEDEVSVQPDLTILYGHRKGYTRPLFVEVERTHKNVARLRRRLAAYGYLLSAKGEGAVDQVFQREHGITPQRGMALFVCADTGAAERLRALAKTVVSADTELWFTSIERLLERKPRTKADGTPHLDRHGQPQKHDVPISPEAFFARDILVALDGKRGKLVV
ncbi:MAG: replication-relaxation family protein [Polyangiaceae bacterium]|jgi:hypothetical protein|nr:replication-relaxation family protein [Polyangiaceae bacterium]